MLIVHRGRPLHRAVLCIEAVLRTEAVSGVTDARCVIHTGLSHNILPTQLRNGGVSAHHSSPCRIQCTWDSPTVVRSGRETGPPRSPHVFLSATWACLAGMGLPSKYP